MQSEIKMFEFEISEGQVSWVQNVAIDGCVYSKMMEIIKI